MLTCEVESSLRKILAKVYDGVVENSAAAGTFTASTMVVD
jgi:hypothetical protein